MKKRIISAIMVSTILIGAIGIPAVALADEFDTKIQQSENKISELSTQEAVATAQLATVKVNIEEIRAQAAELQEQQAKLNQEIIQLATDIQDLTVKIEKRDATIKDQARSVQVDGKATNYIDAVLSADSVSSAITRVFAASTIVNASNDMMKQQEKDKKSVETKKATSETKSEELGQTAAELEASKGQLVDQELQQQALVSEIAAERTTEESKKAGFLKEKAEAEAARAEQARLAKVAEEQVAARKVEEERLAQEQPTNTTENRPNTPGITGNTVAPGTGNNNPGTGSGGGNTVTPTPPAPIETPTPPAPSGGGAAILAEAAKHIGKPYVWGAQGPDSFDCSGFTSYVYRKAAGREIGGWTVPQENAGTRISVSQAAPGDLLFWGSAGGTYHVAISTGGGNYIHAPAPGQNVTYGSSAYFAPDFAVRM